MDMMSYLLGKKAGGGAKGLKVQVVEELPATGEEDILYLVPKEGSTGDVFDEYIYVNENFEKIGSTDIDLSDYQKTIQYTTMPTASADTVGKIVQYIGTTNANYTNGYFYIGMTDGEETPTYSWENINVQNMSKFRAIEIPNAQDFLDKYTRTTMLRDLIDDLGGDGIYFFHNINQGKTISMDTSSTSFVFYAQCDVTLIIMNNRQQIIKFDRKKNNGNGYNTFSIYSVKSGTFYQSYQYKNVAASDLQTGLNSLAKNLQNLSLNKYLTTDNTTTYTPSGDYNPATKKYVDDNKGQTIQYSIMPTADSTNLGKIVQYIGATDNTYTNGYFYQVISDGQDPATYSWKNIDIQNGGYKYYVWTKSRRDIPEQVMGNTIDEVYSLGLNLILNYDDLSIYNKIRIGYNEVNTINGFYKLVNYKDAKQGERFGYIVQESNILIFYKNESQITGFNSYNFSFDYKPQFINKNQTITGIHTYSVLPQSSVTPTTNNQFTNKAYVDGLVGNINTVLATLTTPTNGGN